MVQNVMFYVANYDICCIFGTTVKVNDWVMKMSLAVGNFEVHWHIEAEYKLNVTKPLKGYRLQKCSGLKHEENCRVYSLIVSNKVFQGALW